MGAIIVVARTIDFAGFVRFVEGYYVYLITERKQVAQIGRHLIYAVEETRLVSVMASGRADKSADEQRYLDVFKRVDLTKNFYFSYTYDLTHTLQRNVTGDAQSFNDSFMWNFYLVQSGFVAVEKASPWVLPLIHGFVEQSRTELICLMNAYNHHHRH